MENLNKIIKNDIIIYKQNKTKLIINKNKLS